MLLPEAFVFLFALSHENNIHESFQNHAPLHHHGQAGIVTSEF